MRIDPSVLENAPPSERKRLEGLLTQLNQAHRDNPLLTYNAPWSPKQHPKQLEYHAAQTKIKAYFAGNRAGKTTAGICDLLIQCVDRDCLPEHLLPFKRWDAPIRARVVAPKFNENIEQVIFPAIRQWCPRSQMLKGNWKDAFSASRRTLELANGTIIQFLTFDQDIDAHAGAALHYVLFDEEPEGDKGRQLWHENMMRLADYDGQFAITMTPLFGLSWAFDEIWRERLRADITVIQSDSFENPHVNREALALEFSRMTREEQQARKEGKFVHFAGLFYPEFGEEHIAKPPTQKALKEQNVIVGIDPGLNRTGVVWLAFDNDNVAVVFDELYPEQAVVEDVAQQIKTRNQSWGIEPDYYVIDPSARNRATINAEAVQAAYARAGIHTIHGQNDRAAGILEVKRRLQQQGLLVAENCSNLVNEIEHYRRDPNSQDEFAAVKKDDHLCDALRYACLSRPWVEVSEPEKTPPWYIPGTAPPVDYWNRESQSSHPLGMV